MFKEQSMYFYGYQKVFDNLKWKNKIELQQCNRLKNEQKDE